MRGKRIYFWFALLIFSASILYLRWIISDFWSQYKNSPEVVGAVINAFVSWVTVIATLSVTILFNLKTQRLMIRQLKINEQQTRASLRDFVYQKRMEFYLELIEKIHKIGEAQLVLASDERYKKFISLLDDLEELYDKKRGLASKKLRELFEHYKGYILEFDVSDNEVDWGKIRFLNTILEDIEFVIDSELLIDKIDSDIYNLIDRSKIKEIEYRLAGLNEIEDRERKRFNEIIEREFKEKIKNIKKAGEY